MTRAIVHNTFGGVNTRLSICRAYIVGIVASQ